MTKKYVTLRICARAKQVFVAGTFNGWKPTDLPMRRVDEEWTIDVPLSSGRHEFKFVVDGQWCCDVDQNGPTESAEACVPNALGTMNRVLHVAEHGSA